MEDRLVLVDDVSKSLLKLAEVVVFGAVLEVGEESASSVENGAGAFRCPKLLLNPFSFTLRSGMVLFRFVMLTETLRDFNQPSSITCDRVGLHGESFAVGDSMRKTEFSGWARKSIPQR